MFKKIMWVILIAILTIILAIILFKVAGTLAALATIVLQYSVFFIVIAAGIFVIKKYLNKNVT